MAGAMIEYLLTDHAIGAGGGCVVSIDLHLRRDGYRDGTVDMLTTNNIKLPVAKHYRER
jgi:hypothetical protein